MKHCPVPVNVTFSCKFGQTWTFEDLAFWEVYRECTQRPGHKVAKHRRREFIHSQFEEKNDNVVFWMFTSSSSCVYEKDKLERMFLSFCISYDELIYVFIDTFLFELTEAILLAFQNRFKRGLTWKWVFATIYHLLGGKWQMRHNNIFTVSTVFTVQTVKVEFGVILFFYMSRI